MNVSDHDYGPRGLLIREPHASLILNGDKSWEIRGKATQLRGTIVILRAGSLQDGFGQALGSVQLTRVLGPLSRNDLVHAKELPLAQREEIERDGLPYKKTYAWVLVKPRWFDEPQPYRHPHRAAIWARLPDFDLSHMTYAPAGHRNQLQAA